MTDDIYTRVIRHYGTDHQKRKAVEELNELAAEILKDIDGHGDPTHVIEELADVENMCAQLRIIYGHDDLIDRWKGIKMERAVKKFPKTE